MPKFMIVYQYRNHASIIHEDVQFTNDYDIAVNALQETKDFYDIIKAEIYAYSDDTGYVRLGGNL